MNEVKPKVLVVLGPTATGKSTLAVKLAKKFRGEVISADSRQVYRGLNIGTGKITKKEMSGIHHFLLDVADPKKVFTVADWKKMTEEKIETLLKRHKLPIICGGTGFYIKSVVEGTILPEVPPNKTLRKKLEKKSLSELVKILNKLDSARLKNIDQKNPVRLVRAIEIATALGKVPKIRKDVKYDVLQIGINLDPKKLKEKIRIRLLKRIKQGMILEGKKLHARGLSFKRMRQLGLEYSFIADFLENKMSKKEFAEKLETETQHYAKRQMTWFKKDKNINWHSPAENKKIEAKIKKFLTET